MKQLLVISALVLILLIGVQGFALGKDLANQAKHAEQLEYDFVFAKPINLDVDRIPNILSNTDADPIEIEVTERIINPTSSRFEIDDLNIKFLTPVTQEVIAEQKGGVPGGFEIKPNSKDNKIQLRFKIFPNKAKRLIEQNGGEAQIIANRLTSPDYGITFILRGSVTVMGIDLPIDERITI